MDTLIVRPVSWSFVSSTIPNSGRSSIQMFGYNQDGESVYVRFPYFSTLLVKYNEDVSEDDVIELQLSLGALDSNVSKYDKSVAIITDPTSYLMDVIKDEVYALDPYGVYTTFFQQNGIIPYKTLLLKKYRNFSDITVQKRHYNAIAGQVVLSDTSISAPIRLLFWDIETYTDSDEFTNPNRDPVTLISVVTVVGDYRTTHLLTRIKIDDMKDVHIMYYPDEAKLIEGFYNLWKDFKPDRSITYNGLSYDIPYMIARASTLNVNIGQLGKIKGLNAWTDNHLIPTPIGIESKRRFITPGVEEVDLVLYFRLKYPWLPNHKLDTVAFNLLGKGKTGLSIERMFEIFKNGDPKEMKEAAEYSVMDVILLDELYSLIEQDLEDTANSLSVTIEELLISEPKNVINKQIYSLDPGLYFYHAKKRKGDYTIAPDYGVYANVEVYDYSDIILRVMLDSPDHITSTLARRSEVVGTTLVKALWDCRATTTNYKDIIKYLDKFIANTDIVEVNKNVLVSVNKLESELVSYKYTCSFYIILSNVSRYLIYNDEEKACMGRSNICKPKYTLEEMLIEEWLNSIKNNEEFVFDGIDSDDVTLFVRNVKVYSHDEYSNVPLKRTLYEQSAPITTFKNVKYVMTKDGAQIYTDQDIDDIDIKYYEKELKNLYNKLKKISGVNNSKVFY